MVDDCCITGMPIRYQFPEAFVDLCFQLVQVIRVKMAEEINHLVVLTGLKVVKHFRGFPHLSPERGDNQLPLVVDPVPIRIKIYNQGLSKISKYGIVAKIISEMAFVQKSRLVLIPDVVDKHARIGPVALWSPPQPKSTCHRCRQFRQQLFRGGLARSGYVLESEPGFHGDG